MKLREKIKHKYSHFILVSTLTEEVTDRISKQHIETTKNLNVKRMWERLYWEVYDQASEIYKQANSLPESNDVNYLVASLSDLLRTIEQYKE